MTKEKLEMAKWMLSNGHPCSTSEDFSLSIRNRWMNDWEIEIYPQENRQWWIDTQLTFLLSLTEALNVYLSIETKYGLPVVLIL